MKTRRGPWSLTLNLIAVVKNKCLFLKRKWGSLKSVLSHEFALSNCGIYWGSWTVSVCPRTQPQSVADNSLSWRPEGKYLCLHAHSRLLWLWFSNQGPWISNVKIPSLVRNANQWALPQTYWILTLGVGPLIYFSKSSRWFWWTLWEPLAHC
jgi:hypothetical protein